MILHQNLELVPLNSYKKNSCLSWDLLSYQNNLSRLSLDKETYLAPKHDLKKVPKQEWLQVEKPKEPKKPNDSPASPTESRSQDQTKKSWKDKLVVQTSCKNKSIIGDCNQRQIWLNTWIRIEDSKVIQKHIQFESSWLSWTKNLLEYLYTLGSDMPESEPMALVQGMILQIRKHIPPYLFR